MVTKRLQGEIRICTVRRGMETERCTKGRTGNGCTVGGFGAFFVS